MEVTFEGEGNEGKGKSSSSKVVCSHLPLPLLNAAARVLEAAAQ